MQHTDNGAVEVPSGLTVFRTDQGVFTLDVVAAIRKQNALRQEHQGKDHYAYLDAFRSWVQEQTGAQLNDSQADWLDDHLSVEYAKVKKKRADELLSLRSSRE